MNKRFSLIRSLLFVALPLWLSYWLIKTRAALLDDALIHLHYADLLHRLHFITFDGICPSFGTSSLLYVSLLALLRGFISTPLLPKIVSDLSYLALIGFVVTLLMRHTRHPLSQLLLGELLLCLITPMGIRWLTDGMETSLTNLLIVTLAVITKKEQETYTPSVIRYVLLVIFGSALVYLRIELALIIALSCLSILVIKHSAGKSGAAALIEASPLSVGAVLALLSIRIALGNFLPDTALAKSGHWSLTPAIVVAQVLASSVLLGCGLASCWALSVLATVRRVRQSPQQRTARTLAVILENIAIFLVVALSCLRGQNIQGVRYVIWPLIFAIVANALQLARDESAASVKRSIDGVQQALARAFVVIFLCALPLDWRFAAAAMRGRTQTFLQMRAANLDQLFQDKTIIASDVGFITYFTNARTCDLAGLVNGRTMATMKLEERAAYCAQQSPSMLFLTAGQIHLAEHYMNLRDWSICGIYDFTNVHSNDRHYLIVPAIDAAAVCHRLNFAPKQLSNAAASGS